MKLTEEGAATFDTLNAKAMADYYLDDAEIDLVSKNDEGLKVEMYKGRGEIEKAYAEAVQEARDDQVAGTPSSTPSSSARTSW